MSILPIIFAVSTLTFTADRMAVDNKTKAASAKGHIVAKSGPMTLRGDCFTKSAEGVYHFDSHTCATTCSNEVGHTHWNITGEIEYQDNDHVLVRDAWLNFYEIPIFYMPYFWYPLDTKCGFSWMVGYTGRWGGYLMTKYRYHILGDPEHSECEAWMKGDTRLDLRTKNGVALGEDLEWGLGDFGKGEFNVYYAWDEDYDSHSRGGWNRANWGSDVDRDRYGLTLKHLWEPTERDIVHVGGSYLSDSYFRRDFYRSSLLSLRSDFTSYENAHVFWEHLENSLSVGVEASGRLNDFYSSTERLPEIYLDIAPQPVWNSPINYESENKVGWLRRRYARYAAGSESPFGSNPGLWADYESARLDTYHRLTAPFRTLGDTMSVVPRLAYHGTLWNRAGLTDLTGAGEYRHQHDNDEVYRSIIEGGVTFAGRGVGEINNRWSHMFEPYFDVLAQEADYCGTLNGGSRPYVFDAIDASRTWEEQYAGRGRNLPYSYYGVTPGWRNAWLTTDEKGNAREVIDFDVYAAVQFNRADMQHAPEEVSDSAHRLADPGSPNYGDDHCWVAPGTRLRWHVDDDTMIGARAEYDSDRNRLAYAELMYKQRVNKDFDYHLNYYYTDSRYWDFSSSPYDAEYMREDIFNFTKIDQLEAGVTVHPIEWFAMSPFVRWDCREGELDVAGAWFDYLTDCLGFRFTVEYENDFTYIDGREHDDDWNFSFNIYLRAFGFGTNSFNGK